MKKDYEVYRDTGILGGYHPEMAVLREQRGGEVMTTFRDTNYQQRGESPGEPAGDAYPGEGIPCDLCVSRRAIATPTDKLLSLIDAEFSEKGHSA